MKLNKFYPPLLRKLKNRQDIVIKKYKLHYKGGNYDFLRIASKSINSQDNVILICAGIHGEETAGPLTILNFINEIVDYIHQNNLKCVIYPLINPSGFKNCTRYNIDNDRGEYGNNDFLRYEIKKGILVDDLTKSKNGSFKKWYWSSDKKLGLKLPQETVLMHKVLKNDPLSKVIAVLDLHQDYISDAPSAAYQYTFGDNSVYNDIINKIKKIIPLYKNKNIEAGEASPIRSDNQGFIKRHDGSLTDLVYRLGVKHCITVETTGKTPLKTAQEVNLIWIFGVVDILHKNKAKTKTVSQLVKNSLKGSF